MVPPTTNPPKPARRTQYGSTYNCVSWYYCSLHPSQQAGKCVMLHVSQMPASSDIQ